MLGLHLALESRDAPDIVLDLRDLGRHCLHHFERDTMPKQVIDRAWRQLWVPNKLQGDELSHQSLRLKCNPQTPRRVLRIVRRRRAIRCHDSDLVKFRKHSFNDFRSEQPGFLGVFNLMQTRHVPFADKHSKLMPLQGGRRDQTSEQHHGQRVIYKVAAHGCIDSRHCSHDAI